MIEPIWIWYTTHITLLYIEEARETVEDEQELQISDHCFTNMDTLYNTYLFLMTIQQRCMDIFYQ